MIVKEVRAKAILSKSKVFEYVVNPYTGCEHACTYCYARFMKRFSGHKEAWGEFVDVKINACDLLPKELRRKRKGRVWMSGVCDPYQPLEARYKLSRGCLEILGQEGWPVTVQTRSPLVLRDLEILKEARDFEVGLTVTTGDDDMRRLFEPNAPLIKDRLDALEGLHRAGVRTFAMVAPMLPGAEGLAEALAGRVDYVMVDRMNYNYGTWVYRKYGLESMLTDDYFHHTGHDLANACRKLGIECRMAY